MGRSKRRDGAKSPPKKRPQCGENRGYQAHMRRWEEPCPACREAHAVWMKAARQGRRPDGYTPHEPIRKKMTRRMDQIMGMSDEAFDAWLASSQGARRSMKEKLK